MEEVKKKERAELEKLLHYKTEELDAVSAHFKMILNNMSQGLLFVTIHGMIIEFNPAAENLTGVESEKVLKQSFWKQFDDNFFGFSMKEALFSRKSIGSKTVGFQSFLGIDRIVEVDTTYVEAPVAGLLLMIRDATETQKLQKENQQIEGLNVISQLSRNLADEIVVPLGYLKESALELKHLLARNPSLYKKVITIVESIDELDSLTDKIFNFSRPIEVKKEFIDLKPLFLEFKEKISEDPLITENIKIHFLTTAGPCEAHVDTTVIKKTLLHLVQNAIVSMPGGGTLTLSLEKKANCVRLSVSDTGKKLDQEKIDHLYQPSFMLQSESCGLAEVCKAVKAHGGAIEVRATEEKGNFISIVLES